jgi:transcriptional regulator with PAS, ATPase and Fis domain
MQQFGAGAPPDAAGRGPTAGLVLLYADEYVSLPAAWPLSKKRVVIGRDETADVLLPVKAVSRKHAEIVWERGRWILRDLGSTNGVIVDGELTHEAELEALHEIRIGDAVVKFVDQDLEAFARYRIDGTMTPGEARLSARHGAVVGGFQIDRISAELERISPTMLTIVLLGESGTGKEVFAREAHRLSGRKGNFQAINCGAIPENLIESELFGYKRGAFSGADRDKPGIFKAADGGTLLLDEIGDMPEQAQVKLLRVLQNREVFPVGATSAEPVDVRVVCATHRDLGKLQSSGAFRQDLFARINEYQLRLPPLRERKEDIHPLVQAFIARHGTPNLRASFSLMTGLIHHEWPYNVRELEACIKRCIALSDGQLLHEGLLPESVSSAMNVYGEEPKERPAGGAPAQDTQRASTPTEQELRDLLTTHAGNVAAVGRQLGKARMQVHRWMRKYGIDIDDFREPS